MKCTVVGVDYLSYHLRACISSLPLPEAIRRAAVLLKTGYCLSILLFSTAEIHCDTAARDTRAYRIIGALMRKLK